MPRFAIARLLLVVWVISLSGCVTVPGSDLTIMEHMWLLGDDPRDSDPKYTAPMARMERYRALRDTVAREPEMQRDEVARRLTGEFQVERDPLIRAEIVRTAGSFQSTQSNELLKIASSDSDAEVRLAACGGWARRRTDMSIAQLSQLATSDSNVEVRMHAVSSLGDLGHEAAIPTLRTGLDSQDPAMQLQCMESLKQVTKQDFGQSVIRWKQFVDGRTPDPPREISFAERVESIMRF